MDHFFHPANMWANNHNNSEVSFTPLFRLLDDFGRYSSSASGGSRPGARAAAPTFQPKFDVRETKTAYELHGEMPGVKRENIVIEFTEPQTIRIRGRIERSHTASSDDNDTTKAITGADEVGDDDDKAGRASPTAFKATVQDEADAEAEGKGITTPTTSVATPAASHAVAHAATPKKTDVRYWVTERSIGEFARTFNLPTRVDQDAVSAGLKDGVLTVVIPKSKKHETRRIVVA